MFKKIKEYLSPPESQYSAAQIMRWLWNAWRGNRFQAVLNATIGLLSVVVSLSSVWAIQNAIDIASHVKPGSIYWAVGLMALLVLCNFALSISSTWIRNILGVRAQNRMQQSLLDRILRSEWHSKEKRHTGDIINRLEMDVNSVIKFLTEVMPSSVSTLAMFLGAFFYLYSLDKMLSLIIVVMIPVVAILSRVYVHKMRQLSREVRKSDSKVQSVLTETIQKPQHRLLAGLSDRLPVECHPLVQPHAHFRWHDGLPAVGQPCAGSGEKPHHARSAVCLRLHSR